MNGRERVLRAIEFRRPDRVPFISPFPPASDVFFFASYPASDWQPDPGNAPHIHPGLQAIGNWRWKDMTVDTLLHPPVMQQDEFGCVWESFRMDNVGEVVGHPLKSMDDVDSILIPDPHRPERFETFAGLAKVFGAGKFKLADIGNGIWERSHFLRGFSEIMEDLGSNPSGVERLLDRILEEWQIGMIEEYSRLGCDAVMFYDDWGMKDRIMISPAMWRRMFKPRYSRLIEEAHARGLKVFMHSCGNLRMILDDLIEIGLDVLQKEDIDSIGMDYLAERYKGKICFMSPLDVQSIFPFVKDGDVGAEVRRMISAVGSDGGGLIGTSTFNSEAVGIPFYKNFVLHYEFLRNGRYGADGRPLFLK